jgi:hypothetical protein
MILSKYGALKKEKQHKHMKLILNDENWELLIEALNLAIEKDTKFTILLAIAEDTHEFDDRED